MFDAKIKSEVLKEAVDAINILVDEAKINVTKDELHIRAVDPAHVAMVNFKLNKKAFEDYKAKECELGVDLDKIKEILKLVKSGDVIHLKQDEDKNRLVIRFGNLTRRMSLVDTAGMSDPKMPNLEFSTKATISTGELRRAVKASENVSDHITLMVSPEAFEVASKGETDSVDLRLPKDLIEELDCKDSTSSMFPLNYFSSMINAVNTPKVILHMAENYPVKMEFEIAEGAGWGEYLLAPRIENE